MPRWLGDADPDRLAVVAPDGTLTYAQLLARATATEPEPYLDATPGLDFVVGLHACLLQGVTAVPLDPRLTAADRAARRAVARRGALLLFTSGTTGAPKPVALELSHVEASTATFPGRGDWATPLPLAHVGGLMVPLRCAIWGTTALLGDHLDADYVSLVPTQLQRLREAPRAHVILGGAPPPLALLDRARVAGVRVSVTYGMTETCSMVALDGVPLTDVEIAPDGEIVVRGPMVVGGEHRTGDLGRLDDGVLTVIGRRSDTIITGAENVAPTEVEAVLAAHPDVADAAVLGRPDAEWGEAVTALVVPRAGATPDPADLRSFCRARLAPFKVPKVFETVDALPRTSSGKLLRRHLR